LPNQLDMHKFFGKIRKNALQQFGITTYHFSQLDIIPPPARKYARAYRSCYPSPRGASTPSRARRTCSTSRVTTQLPSREGLVLLPSRDFISFPIAILPPLVHGKPHHLRRLLLARVRCCLVSVVDLHLLLPSFLVRV
jgi:hypothetical protein